MYCLPVYKTPRANIICCGENDNTNTLREKAKLLLTQILIVKTCKDLYSMPVPAYRPMQDSLTALTTELRALSQPQPRNVRISSTLLPGMSKVPFPFFFKRSQILSPPLFWTCHIPPPSFQRCQAPPSRLSPKSWVSSVPNILNYLIPLTKRKIHYQVAVQCQVNSCQVLSHKH